MRGGMSIVNRYYEVAYGSALGYPQLTTEQWKLIIKTAVRQTSWRRKLSFGIPFGLVLGLGYVTITLAFIRWLSSLNPYLFGLYVGVALAFPQLLLTLVTRPLIFRPAARRAAVELGFIQMCIECGYPLKGNTSGKCPECGAELKKS